MTGVQTCALPIYSNAVAESATNISSEESDALEAENDSITETIEATEKGDDNDRD